MNGLKIGQVRQRVLTLFMIAMILLSTFSSILLSNVNIANAQIANNKSPLASSLSSDFAVEWMQLIYDRVKAETIDAPGAARVYAYSGVTLYEAVLPGIPGDVSLESQIKGMPTMPALEPDAVYDWPSVANAALQTLTSGLLSKDDSQKAIADLRAKQTAQREAAVGKEVVARSLARGEAIGKAITAWAAADGATDARAKGKSYQLPTENEWNYVLTTAGTNPVGAYWGMVRPFGLESSDICKLDMTVQFSSDPKSTLYKQAMEVKNVGDHLTDEQKAIANWWVDTPGLTGAPSGHWMLIASQMVDGLNLKLDRAAETYAMVGIALGDAFIACWQTKYINPFLRPITYINRYINPQWHSFIASPPFPTFVSGHSVASEAAAEVLTALFGDVAFTDSTHVKEGQQSRSFTSFESAAYEAAISRLYGGIHFRMDIEGGLRQGHCVAEHILNNIHLH